MTATYRILLIEDDQDLYDFIANQPWSRDFKVDFTVSGEEGVKLARLTDYDLVVTDIFISGINGLDVLKNIKAFKPQQKCIVMSGNEVMLQQASEVGDVCLQKPFTMNELQLSVLNLVSH